MDASYHQVFLAPIDTAPVYDGQDTGPLVSVVDEQTALIVTTGCMDGPVHLTIHLHPGSASPPTDDHWEVQEEVSVHIGHPLITWSPLGAPQDERDFNRPVLVPKTPGPHRIRVSGRGRGSRKDDYVMPDEPPTEHYLIEAWPEFAVRHRVTLLDDGHGLTS